MKDLGGGVSLPIGGISQRIRPIEAKRKRKILGLYKGKGQFEGNTKKKGLTRLIQRQRPLQAFTKYKNNVRLKQRKVQILQMPARGKRCSQISDYSPGINVYLRTYILTIL